MGLRSSISCKILFMLMKSSTWRKSLKNWGNFIAWNRCSHRFLTKNSVPINSGKLLSLQKPTKMLCNSAAQSTTQTTSLNLSPWLTPKSQSYRWKSANLKTSLITSQSKSTPNYYKNCTETSENFTLTITALKRFRALRILCICKFFT